MEFVTDGRMYERNGYFYLIYDESEISGLEGFRTTLKFNENSLKMKRMSKEGPGPELYFEEGKRFSSNYETPMGPMEVEVLTRSVNNLMDRESKKGSVDVEYDISLGGFAEGKNKLIIDVM
jgi:uncharacterized beta-barrel protein YwiB (DUF1934 family)